MGDDEGGIEVRALPKKTYELVVELGSGSPWRYAEKGGGHYSVLGHARNAAEQHRKKGREARIYESDCVWSEVE